MARLIADQRAIQLHPDDNVATLISTAERGAGIRVTCSWDPAGSGNEIVLKNRVPAGHKVAVAPIGAGEPVRKYGSAIGRATKAIGIGELAHVENVASTFSPSHDRVSTDAESEEILVPHAQLRAAVDRVLATHGVPSAAAEALADHIVEAHLRGVETHGIRRLKPYLARIRAGGVDAAVDPRFEADGSVIRVDGRNGIGHHVARIAAKNVCAAARRHGSAVALVRNSNHFGFAGYYATQIAAEGMVGLVTSNGQVVLGPDGARKAIFSNDPVAVGASIDDGAFFELDMATSVTSRARIGMAAERGETIAEGLALDENGRPTRDAKAAMKGVLLPFGGAKGFAFVTAIELLTGILGGGRYADQVASKEADASAPEGTCHFLMAIDLEKAIGRDAFVERLRDLIARMRNLPMRDGMEPPRYPGQRRWEMRRNRQQNGVPLSRKDASSLAELLGDERGQFLPGITP